MRSRNTAKQSVASRTMRAIRGCVPMLVTAIEASGLALLLAHSAAFVFSGLRVFVVQVGYLAVWERWERPERCALVCLELFQEARSMKHSRGSTPRSFAWRRPAVRARGGVVDLCPDESGV
jgi:hypothetical protein